MRKILFTLIVLAAPRAALACPVCFGQSDSPMAVATNWGVFTLLVIITGVLAAFGSFIVYLIRRASLAELPAGAVEAASFAGSNPQEGSAQC
jgi:hypothetical protein